MLQHFVFDGSLKIAQYKSISVKVQLEVDTLDDDDWAEPDPNHNPDNYIDGVRITGELSFDTSPLTGQEKHPVRQNAIGELSIRHEGDSSRFNILLVERTGVVDLDDNKRVKRYFWLFFAIGKPMSDGLELFPTNYRGRNMNRIFVCTNFRGYWPVGVASLVIAKDKREAKKLLDQKLRDAGIPIEGDGDYTLTEINIDSPGAVILNDGKF